MKSPTSAMQDSKRFVAASFTVFLLVFFGTGCQIIQTASKVPEAAFNTIMPDLVKETAMDPVELQDRLLRFADLFSGGMIMGIEKLRHGDNPIGEVEALRWKILFGTETSSIASGANAYANLLDMTVFVSVVREVVEKNWHGQLYGESALPLVETCRVYEEEIWKLAGSVLKSEQQTELRNAIDTWHQQHGFSESVLDTRVVGLAQEVSRVQRSDDSSHTSVFTLLGLDPLSGLDPATREIAETRLFAERALYIAQWMPLLLHWHTELLSLKAAAMPEVQQLIANSTQFSASAERFADIAEQWPNQIGSEREELLKALQSQEKGLSALSTDVRLTLAEGTRMSTSVDSTLTTFDGLMQRFGVGEPETTDVSKTESEPFRILDYAQTATRLESAARQLTELLRALDQTLASPDLTRLSAQVEPVVERAQIGGKELVDYAFRQAILFMVITCLLILVTMQLNRWLRLRHENKVHRAP